jgi:hypothetical protein
VTRADQVRMFNALQKRIGSIRHLRSGAITPEQRAALRASYPSGVKSLPDVPADDTADRVLEREWELATAHLK